MDRHAPQEPAPGDGAVRAGFHPNGWVLNAPTPPRSAAAERGERPTTLAGLFVARAGRCADSPALTVGDTTLSYGELCGRAVALAGALADAGVGGGDFVGVLADRSEATVVGILGVLLAGAAYVPIAADLPLPRAASIVRDAGIRVVTGCLGGGTPGTVVTVPTPPPEAVAPPPWQPPWIHPEAPAYAIFTSGSTGEPKGVVSSHRAVVNSTLARFGVFPSDDVTYLMLAPLTFDAAVAGLYFTLFAGGRLVMPTDEQVLDPALVASLALRERATHVDGVPAQYATLIEYQPAAVRHARCAIVAGEPLPQRLVRRHYQVAPGVPLFNEYGPTEGTVWSTVHVCAPDDDGPLAPIGAPVAGVRVHLLNGLEPVTEDGAVGEIVIGGKNLATCYLGRPGMTAERFVPDPDPAHPGDRVYRTGDQAFVDAQGRLVYRSRTDRLVKVRGFRVELAEVEARLSEHPDLLGAVVLPQRSDTGVRLVAVVAAARPVTAGELAAFLRASLPDYMTPSLWRRLDSLPLTRHGKVDRSALEHADPREIGTNLAR